MEGGNPTPGGAAIIFRDRAMDNFMYKKSREGSLR